MGLDELFGILFDTYAKSVRNYAFSVTENTPENLNELKRQMAELRRENRLLRKTVAEREPVHGASGRFTPGM